MVAFPYIPLLSFLSTSLSRVTGDHRAFLFYARFGATTITTRIMDNSKGKRVADELPSPGAQGSGKRHRTRRAGEWILGETNFKTWLEGGQETPPVLWIQGPPGSGKTFLARGIVRQLESRSETRLILSYFCDSYSTPGSIARSLLEQLSQHPSVGATQASIASALARDTSLAEEGEFQLWDKLTEVLQLAIPAIIVVDGLDELALKFVRDYEYRTPARLIGLVEPEGTKARLLLSSRLEPSIRRILQTYPNISVTADKVHDDLEDYVREEVEKDEHLRSHSYDIVRGLVQKADGIILWAELSLQTLRMAKNESEVLSLLNGLPTQMTTVYNRLFNRTAEVLGPQEIFLRDSIIRWVVSVIRPLSPPELMNAVLLDTNAFLHDIEQRVTELCGALIKAEDGRLKPSHFSLREYLLNKHESAIEITHFDLDDANLEVARSCLRYLSNRPFSELRWKEGQIESLCRDYPFLEYSTLYWVHHVVQSKAKVAELHSEIRAFVKLPHFLVWFDRFLPAMLSRSVIPVPPRPQNSCRFLYGFLLKSQLVKAFDGEAKDDFDSEVSNVIRNHYESALDGARPTHGVSLEYIQRLMDLSEVDGWLPGRRKNASILAETAIKVAEQLPSGSLVSLSARQAWGDDLKRNGRYEEAVVVFKSLLEHLQGPNISPIDDRLLFAHDSLGWAQSKLGSHEDAVTHFRIALDIAKDIYGSDSLLTTRTAGSLAEALVAIGRQDEAEILCKQLEMQLREYQKLGMSLSRDVVNGLNTLAAVYRAQTRWVEARDTFSIVVDERRNIFGYDHPMTLWASFQLATTRIHCGERDLARQELEDLLPRQEKILGIEHPDIPQTKTQLEILAED